MEALMLNTGTVNTREITEEVVTPTELHVPEKVVMTDAEWCMAEAEKKANLAYEAISTLSNLIMGEAEPEKAAVAIFKAILMNEDESVKKAVAILVDEAESEDESEKDYDDLTDEEAAALIDEEIDMYLLAEDIDKYYKNLYRPVDWGTEHTLSKANRAQKRDDNLNLKRKARGLKKPHDRFIKNVDKTIARRINNLRSEISTAKADIANMRDSIATTVALSMSIAMDMSIVLDMGILFKIAARLAAAEYDCKKLIAEKQELEALNRPRTVEGNPRYYREPTPALSSPCTSNVAETDADWWKPYQSTGDSETMVSIILPKQKHPKAKKKKKTSHMKAPCMVAHV